MQSLLTRLVGAGLLLVGTSQIGYGQQFDPAVERTGLIGRQNSASLASYPAGCHRGCPPQCACPVVPVLPDADRPEEEVEDFIPDFDPEAALAPGQFAALDVGVFAASDNVAGYIDNAIPMTQVRMRYDIAWGADSDRAEFLYGAWSPMGGPTRLAVERLDFHQISTYVERAFSPRFSVFVDAPVRFNNVSEPVGAPDLGGDPRAAGLADMSTGFKYALLADPDRLLTFQLRVIAPTGNPHHALGVGHAAIEPGLLFQTRPAQRWTLFGELRDWIGLGGTVVPDEPEFAEFAGQRFTGNVLQYGLGAGYDFHRSWDDCCRESRLTGVAEFVGWTLLDGLETADLGQMQIRDATGDTIVNAKYGLRYTRGDHSIYASYGHALTDRVWYRDIFRLEYRLTF